MHSNSKNLPQQLNCGGDFQVSVTATFTPYRRNGVREYIVWRTLDGELDWFGLKADDYVLQLPDEQGMGVVYFCEVQFQKDKELYERLFSESLLYFYRNRSRFSDWQAVIIYPSHSLEQNDIHPYRSLLNGEQVHRRIYLDELGEVQSLPLPVAATVLTIVEEAEAAEVARYLLARTEQAELTPGERANLIQLKSLGD